VYGISVAGWWVKHPDQKQKWRPHVLLAAAHKSGLLHLPAGVPEGEALRLYSRVWDATNEGTVRGPPGASVLL
jgi:hypothetical protein